MASEMGFDLGLKVVRGAYLEFENRRAQNLGYESPILGSFEMTSESYDKYEQHFGLIFQNFSTLCFLAA